MPYTAVFIHVTFATFDRAPLITPSLRPHLHAFLGGIARNIGCKPIEIGGVADHAHALIELNPKISISELVSKLKSNSSRWIREAEAHPAFNWQRGYGAFSVCPREVEKIRRYIREQEEHHRTRTFREEYIELLEQSGVEFDPETCLR